MCHLTQNGKFKQAQLEEFNCSSNLESLPDSLMTATRDVVFFTWQTLEAQLSQVDHRKYPEISQALDISASAVFDTWLTFRDIGRGEV